MLIRAKAPLRLSFGGGGTDVSPFPETEGGSVLSATINRYAYGTLRTRDDDRIVLRSLDFGVTVSYSLDDKVAYDGKLDLVKAAIEHIGMPPSQGFDLFLHTDAPPGSGLGSSSALMVALVALLDDWHGLSLTDYQIAELAVRIERKELAIPGGLQDQYAATFGGFNFIEFLPDRVIVNPLRVSPAVQNELQYNLLLAFTGKSRMSDKIIEDQVGRYVEKKQGSVEALRQLKRISVDMKNCIVGGELEHFGPLLHEQWQQKKQLSSRISTPEIDALYAAALAAGATGGKVTGAGGGGFFIFYCPRESKHEVAKRAVELGCTIADIGFEPTGVQTWRVEER